MRQVRSLARRALDTIEAKASIAAAVEHAAVVGTYTTPSGPELDDYFLAIVDRSGGMTSVSMGEARDVIRALEEQLQTTLVFGLSGSTDFASQVSYPPELQGRPMLRFTLPSGFWATVERIRNFGWEVAEIGLSDDVARHLHRLGSHQGS